MTAAATVRTAIASGVRVKLDGDRLVLSAAQRPNNQLVEEIRSQKPKIVDYLRDLSCWGEDDWQALFDERAGIIEFDGARSRADAEALAKLEVDALRELVGKGGAEPVDIGVTTFENVGATLGEVGCVGALHHDDDDLRAPEFLDRVKYPRQGDLPTHSWVTVYPSGGLIPK